MYDLGKNASHLIMVPPDSTLCSISWLRPCQVCAPPDQVKRMHLRHPVAPATRAPSQLGLERPGGLLCPPRRHSERLVGKVDVITGRTGFGVFSQMNQFILKTHKFKRDVK